MATHRIATLGWLLPGDALHYIATLGWPLGVAAEVPVTYVSGRVIFVEAFALETEFRETFPLETTFQEAFALETEFRETFPLETTFQEAFALEAEFKEVPT